MALSSARDTAESVAGRRRSNHSTLRSLNTLFSKEKTYRAPSTLKKLIMTRANWMGSADGFKPAQATYSLSSGAP